MTLPMALDDILSAAIRQGGARLGGPAALSFSTFESYFAFNEALWDKRLEIERALSQQTHARIVCASCGYNDQALVSVGVLFADQPNLREGMLCKCGLSNRQRLMLEVMEMAAMEAGGARAAVFELGTPLCAALTRRGFALSESTFGLARDNPGFQDITATSYADRSFDLVLHSDVLEHVPDYRKALADNLRILRPGGRLVFTAPFFAIEKTVVRARVTPDGEIEHFLPPEMHGDPHAPEGILAFYNFGWSLLEDMRAAGFEKVEARVLYAPGSGLLTSNHPSRNRADASDYGNMMPVALVGARPT